jgi:ABC-type lipoprotein release transport system permease subunit
LVLAEGLVLAVLGVPLALLLGVVVRHPLDAILRATPGIPQDLRFFVMTLGTALRTVGLLVATSTVGAAYPAWLAARVNVATTLHREAQ